MLRFMKFILFCFSTSILIAGTDGTIRGQVMDVYGEPLPGVQILIEDLSQGAVTDLDGNYIILNVQVGTYDIKTSMIGYATIVTQGCKYHHGSNSVAQFNNARRGHRRRSSRGYW